MSLYDKASLIFSGAAGAGNEEVAYNIKPVEKLKVDEYIENGGFDTDSVWIKNTDAGQEATISGGKGILVGDGSKFTNLQQNDVFEADKVYKVSLEAEIKKGELKVQSNGYDGNIGVISKSGKHSFYFTGISGSPHLVLGRRSPSVDFDIEVDNVSVREVEQKARDLSFVRASDLTATYEGADGLIKKTRENLLLQSNQFDTTWGGNRRDVTSGQSGYDGSTNAWLLESNAASTSYLEQTVSASGVQTFSVYAKSGTSDFLILYNISTSANPRAWFDLSGDGSVETTLGSDITAKIEKIGSSGWHRCSVTYDKPVTEVRIYVGEADNDFTSVDGKNILIQNAQLEQGLVATPYIHRTDSYSKSTAGIQEDEPRYDYSLDNDAPPVLMLEPERTNKINYSEYFEGSGWSATAEGDGVVPTITTNYAVSPDGSKNATRLQLDLGGGTTADDRSRIQYSAGQMSSDHQTNSLYVKSNSGTVTLFIRTIDQIEVVSVGTDWKRVSASHSNATGYFEFGIDGFRCPNDTVDLCIWGAQVEKGEYASSYIPTYGSAATRKQDQALLGGYKAADKAWTVFMDVADFTNVEGNSYAGHFFFRSLATNQVSSLFFYDTCFGYPKVGGGSGYVCGKLGTSPNSFTGKFAVTYDGESTMKFFVDGTLESTITDADPAYARGIKSGGLQYAGSGSRQSRNIKQLIIFPEALEDADAVSLTT